MMGLSTNNSSSFHTTKFPVVPNAVYSVRGERPHQHTSFPAYPASDQQRSKHFSPLNMFQTSFPNSPFYQGPSEILFYHSHKPYYGFTNFSNHPVVYQGKKYPTSEHLFQSFKFQNYKPDLAEHIRTCSERPSVAFSEARRFQPEVRPNWKEVNIAMMDIVLRLKFEQHDDLREELLGTGNARLVEDSDKDAFWGIGPDKKGRNELGKALERLRNDLRTSSSGSPTPTRHSQSTTHSPTTNAFLKFESPISTVQSPSYNVNVQSPAVHHVRLSPNIQSPVDTTRSSPKNRIQSSPHTSPKFGHNALLSSPVSQTSIQLSPHLVQTTQAQIRYNQAPEQNRPLTEQNSAEANQSLKQPNHNLTESISAALTLKCRIPECEVPVYYDGTVKSGYCSQQHRQEAVVRNLVPPCIKCLKMPQSETDYFCGRGCREESLDKAWSKV